MEYKPYTYLIGWTKLGVWYYGARYAKGCHPSDLWKSYHTSSPTVTQFVCENGDPDFICVRRTFQTAKACRIWESKVLDRINAAKHPSLLNKRNGSWKWATFEIDEAHRAKISEAHKGKIKSKEHVEKIHASRKGFTWSAAHREQMSFHRKGKPRPNSFGEKISNLIWINDGSKHKRIKASDSVPTGWTIGRKTPWRKSKVTYLVTSPDGVTTQMLRGDFVHLLGTKSPNVPSPKPGFTASYRGWTLLNYQEST